MIASLLESQHYDHAMLPQHCGVQAAALPNDKSKKPGHKDRAFCLNLGGLGRNRNTDMNHPGFTRHSVAG